MSQSRCTASRCSRPHYQPPGASHDRHAVVQRKGADVLVRAPAWLGHRSPVSTQHYARITPTTLTRAYHDAGYFARNVRTIEVLIDREAVQQGAPAAGQPWQYFDLAHGYCTYTFFEQCPHRMACARCDFYVPKGSSKAQLLEARGNLQRMLAQIPLTDDERAAVEDGSAAVDHLLERLADTPTPAGRTRVVEGPLDLLTLQQYGVPGLALCGTGCSPATLQLLGQWKHLYAVLDSDAAGQEATTRLTKAFGSRVIPIQLPPGMKDPADLAVLVDGSALLQVAIRQAIGRHVGAAPTPIIQPAIAVGQQQGILQNRVQGPDRGPDAGHAPGDRTFRLAAPYRAARVPPR
jgi:hypothetical protein